MNTEKATYLQSPENDSNQKIVLRRHALQVNPQETKGNSGHGNVQMKECLIKGMTNRRRRVYHESGKGTGRHQATQHKVTHPKHHPHHIPAGLVRLRNGPSERMRNGFEHNNAPQPPMQQVPGIKRYPKQGDQRVIATSHQHQRHEIDSGHGTSPVPHHAGDGMLIATVRNGNHTHRDIHHHNPDNQEHMKPRGQCAKVDSARELEFTVMTPPDQRRVDDVVLDLGEGAIGREKVALAVVGETGETAEMSREAMGELPDVDEGGHETKDEDSDASEVIVEGFMEGPGVA